MHKKGDPNDVNNYRGITLVSSFSQIFTSILNKRVNDWVENNNSVSDAQFSFRKGRSTVDAFFALNAVIQKILNGEKKTFILCVYRPEEGLWRHKLTQFDGIN